ncbi:MAG: hypothetical protein ACFFB2_11080 [Promethearchaeota archaeon]
MIKVENMEDEKLFFSMITPDTPKHFKKILYEAIEDFEEKRGI